MANSQRSESVENVCVWLEKNGLTQYCDLFRDNQIDEMIFLTNELACEMLCRRMANKPDRIKFSQARSALLQRPVQESETPEPEVASHSSRKKDVETIVTNNFVRYGGNNQVVMTGDARVVKIRGGVYTVANLSKKWLDSESSEGEPLRPEYVKIVKNVRWLHKSTLNPPEEAGVLTFPADFDGYLPTVVGTAENLKYYGCSYADGNQIKICLPMEHSARVYTYNPNYVQEWVLGKSAPGLERHSFTHLDMPLSAESGWFVLGKFNDKEETELHLTAFKIPEKQTLVVPPNVIHSNDYLIGEWRTLLADGDIDIVRLKRERHAGTALQPFAFDFPVASNSSLITNDGYIDVSKLLQRSHSYHALNIPDNCLNAEARNVLTIWSRCAIVTPSPSQSDLLDPVFNTITDEELDTKKLVSSLLTDKNFKAYAVDSLKRYHALHDIMTLLPACLDALTLTLDLRGIVRRITPRIVLVAVIESLNDDSQRYFGNFIKKNDLSVPLSYYKFNTNTEQIEYVINFNSIAETLCLTGDRVLLQMGSSSAIGQGKSSLVPYMCLDKRRTSVNATGIGTLRAGCVDVLSGIIASGDTAEHSYILFDLHGTIQKELNHHLIRAIQQYATVLILYMTLTDSIADLVNSFVLGAASYPIIVVVFDDDFDDRSTESKSNLIGQYTNQFKQSLPPGTASSLAVLLAPSASLWTQNSENREFDEKRRAQLLRASFSAAFAQLEPALSQVQSPFRSSFMIQSFFLNSRSNNVSSASAASIFGVETKLKKLLHNYTDETDNLLLATPISYLQGKIRVTEKQLTIHSEEDMMSVSNTQERLTEQLNKMTSMSAFAQFFVELLTRKTFVELLIAERFLENWRSKYERPLQREMFNVKQEAINCTNLIKRCEAEQLQSETQSPADPNVAKQKFEVEKRLNSAKSKFAAIHERIEKLEKKLMNIDLTVGLFLDEIMAIANFNPTLLRAENQQDMVARLAACFVNLMNRGIAVHILRGRPLQCKSPLLNKTIQIAGRNARSAPCVISVIGEQSSAKSSLLNTCFGTNFRVSSGRCTIGIYVSVVHWAELTVVLLDTEGLLSVEEASVLFDNQIVTMAMLSSHLTIINHKGEFSSTLSSLIGMSMYAKAQIQSAIKPALLFILRDQSDTSDEAKSKHFLPQLTSLKQTLQTDAKFLTTSIDELMDISPNAIMLLPNALVKDVDPVMGVEQTYRNRTFPIRVQQLRRMIYALLTASSAKNIFSDFDNMALILTSNWSVIDNLGPDLLSCKSLVELTRMKELQSIAIEIVKPTAATLNQDLDQLVEITLQRLASTQITMASMNTTASKFQTDVERLMETTKVSALKEFADKTKKSYFSTEMKAQWERTIITSLKVLANEWNHLFENRLQDSSHVKIIKDVEDTLIAKAEDRFHQDEASNVEQLRRTMKTEIDELRRASEQNQRALFAESDTIAQKIVSLYNSCLKLHKHETIREIYNILFAMPAPNFMQYYAHLADVWPRLIDFLENTRGLDGFGQRIWRALGASTKLDELWNALRDRIYWFNNTNAHRNREILKRIFTEVIPKLKEDLRQLVDRGHPIYNKKHMMEETIAILEGAVSGRAVTDSLKHLHPTILANDLAVISLRLLIEQSVQLEEQYFKRKSEELGQRIASLEQSVDRQISVMADSSKQGAELADTIASALFEEVRRNISVKITRDIRQAVTTSDHIVHDNVQQLAYASSFVMGNAENILKYVTNINRYFLEVSLGSIRTIFNTVIHEQTMQLESLLCTLLSDINDEVERKECKNYAEVNRMIEERTNQSFLQQTKGYTSATFKFPAALPMSIGNSSLFKSSFRGILGYSSKVSGQVVQIIDSLRAEAFKQCVRAIQTKLGCNERCPGCGAKCAVTTAHEEHVVPRTPDANFPTPSNADLPVIIHQTTHHLARCLNGGYYYETKQPVLHKCYQNWNTSGIHLNETEIMRPASLYYNHRQPGWFENLAQRALKAGDRDAEHAEAEQRRGWMLVRRYLCRFHQLNDYTDVEYERFPETYPVVDSLSPDFNITWNDASL